MVHELRMGGRTPPKTAASSADNVIALFLSRLPRSLSSMWLRAQGSGRPGQR
jgi:hypothetical protein